jgi:hypothetical protein
MILVMAVLDAKSGTATYPLVMPLRVRSGVCPALAYVFYFSDHIVKAYHMKR